MRKASEIIKSPTASPPSSIIMKTNVYLAILKKINIILDHISLNYLIHLLLLLEVIKKF